MKKVDCNVKVQKHQLTRLKTQRKRGEQEEGQQSKMSQLLRNSPLSNKSADWKVAVEMLVLVGLQIRPHRLIFHAQTPE